MAAASPALTRSPGQKARSVSSAVTKFILATIIRPAMPAAWITTDPASPAKKNPAARVNPVRVTTSFATARVTAARIGKASRQPIEGLARTPRPAAPPAKTGSPAKPTTR